MYIQGALFNIEQFDYFLIIFSSRFVDILFYNICESKNASDSPRPRDAHPL